MNFRQFSIMIFSAVFSGLSKSVDVHDRTRNRITRVSAITDSGMMRLNDELASGTEEEAWNYLFDKENAAEAGQIDA